MCAELLELFLGSLIHNFALNKTNAFEMGLEMQMVKDSIQPARLSIESVGSLDRVKCRLMKRILVS